MKNIQALIIGIFTILLFGGATVNAATWTVTKSTNSNDGVCNADCSLREAVAVAGFDDTVVFNGNLIGQTFTLGGDDIVIDKRLTIDGNLDGVNVVFLSGNNTSRHFLVNSFGTLTLKNMILVQGNGTGSGISNSGGSIEVMPVGFLFLDRVSIRGNNSGGKGGAISFSGNSAANPIIVNSSITGNTARSAPAIYNGAILHISNTTIRGNRVINPDANGWGAIANFGNLYMRNCTVVENQAKNGGGIVAFGGFNPSLGDNNYTNLGNTIVGQNTATDSGQDILFFADLVSVGGNLIGDTNTIPGGIFNKTKDAVNLNPLVAPINSGQGGHPIDTHPLQAGSPAINNGVNSLAVEHTFGTPLTDDARGTGFPRIIGGTVDKGAFEDQSNGATLVVSKLTNGNDNVCDTDCSLREAVFAAGQHAGTDNITMALSVFGTMTLGGTEIGIENQNVNIIGYPTLNSNTLVVSGSNTNRVFRLNNANVTMTGFTIANGNGAGQSEPFGGGGLVAFSGSLTLNQMIVRNNSVSTSDLISGGGISANQVNVVRIMNSTINNNTALQSPALSLGGAVAYLTNTTVSTNSGTFADGQGAISTNGALYMRNSTVANNRNFNSTTGIGLYCGAGSTCNIGNSILADNGASGGNDLFVQNGGTLTSVGGNLVENNTGFNNANLSQQNDVISVDPMLLTLSDNGGNVPTIMPNPSSPAVDTGINANASDPFSAAALTTDARGSGFIRISSIVDKGAFETLSPTAAAVSISGRVMNGTRGIGSAKVVITAQNGVSRTVTTNSFGNFRIIDLQSGETYLINVYSKSYSFYPQVITVNEDLVNLNFSPATAGL